MKGWYIKILDDTENTGGYLVLQSPEINFQGFGYDNWFLNLEEIQQHFISNDIFIEWN